MSKIKILECPIKNVESVTKDTFKIELESEYLAKNSYPGQFLHIKIDEDLSLRRPFSIHRIKKNRVLVLFKVRGRGTSLLSKKQKNQKLNVIGPLGRGFKIPKVLKEGEIIILAGGGLGIAPLYFLAQKIKDLKFKKNKIFCILGFKEKKDVICEEDFKSLGFKTYIVTEKTGVKKNLVDFLEEFVKNKKGYIYLCGPKEMINSLKEKKFKDFKIQVSLENFLGCGIGMCKACSILTKEGTKLVCKDGPVFDIEDLKI